MKKSTPSKRNKLAIEEIQKRIETNIRIAGYTAFDMVSEIDDDFKMDMENEITNLMYETDYMNDLLRILKGE